MKPTYNPAVFNVHDIQSAMRIILTPEGVSTQDRWRIETPYLADLIAEHIAITPDTTLVDYGCGIGRMAKELITRHNCRVVEIDISPSMRALAIMYVQSDRFLSCPPAMFDRLVEQGVRFDAAVSIWVLQHCLDPAEDIARIKRSLKPGAGVFIVNNNYRAVPTVEDGWSNDGLDIRAMLGAEFMPQASGRPVREKTSDSIAELTFWASFKQRGGNSAGG